MINALNYLTIGLQYLHLVENVVQKTIEYNNCWLVESNAEISWDDYDAKTKWSDHRIIIPVMFNLFHGIELTLKGLLMLSTFNRKANHKISKLVNSIAKLYKNSKILDFYFKYTKMNNIPEPLRSFFSKSCISVNEYYQAFKYPENFENNKEYMHIELKYKGNEGLNFYQDLYKDINIFIKELVKLVNSKKSELTRT